MNARAVIAARHGGSCPPEAPSVFEPRVRQEREPVAFAPSDHGLVLAVGDAVPVLDRGDDPPRALELDDVDVREPDVADLSLGAEGGREPDRLFQRDVRVDAVELVEVDPLVAEALEALGIVPAAAA